MPENAFARFRRLRGLAQSVAAAAQPQPTEERGEEAPLTPVTPSREPEALQVRLTSYPRSRVRCRAPHGVWTPTLLAAINAHQAALADLLEAFEERVAIAEVCGGLPRAEAERLAWSCVLGEEAARGSIVEGVS